MEADGFVTLNRETEITTPDGQIGTLLIVPLDSGTFRYYLKLTGDAAVKVNRERRVRHEHKKPLDKWPQD